MSLVRRSAYWLSVGTALSWGLLAHAQTNTPNSTPQAATASADGDQLEEIIVTAERRSADVQKTATSIAVRGGQDLKDEGRTSLEQILEDVAGVSTVAASLGPNASADNQGVGIIIRGATPNTAAAGSQISVVPTTAVYTDDIYEGLGSDFDIDHVEILRGPQGTLYGRSATGGVVATHTRDPELEKFGANVDLEYGSYDLRHNTAVFNLPIGDTLALRLGGSEYLRDGFDSKDGGAVEEYEGRAKLLYQPSDDLSVLAGWALQDNHTHSGGELVTLPTPDTFSYTPAATSSGMNISRQYWANINWNLGLAKLTYVPAFRTWYEDNPGSVLAGPGGLTIVQPVTTPLDQFSTQELRLSSNPNSVLTWVVGGLYYDNRLFNTNSVRNEANGGLAFGSTTRKETQDEGVFAEVTYPFLPSWRLTGGMRYDYTYVDTDELYTSNINAFNVPENDVTLAIQGNAGIRRFYNYTYKVRVETDLTATNLLYASVSSGFLPGDVSATTGAGNQPMALPYAEETLTAYEIGSKNRFLSNALQLNADVYYYRYSGYQQAINTSSNPLNPAFAIGSSPARMRGFEAEGLYQITSDDRAGLSFAYISAFFQDESTFFAQYVAQQNITNIAPRTATASYDHTFHLPWNSSLDLHGDARYASAHDLSVLTPANYDAGYGPYVHVDNEVVGDVNLTWSSEGGKYALTAYCRNVGDNRYKQSASVLTPPATGTQYDPRTFGVVLHASY